MTERLVIRKDKCPHCGHAPLRCDVTPGAPYTLDQCRFCWKYQHDPEYRAACESEKPVSGGVGTELHALLAEYGFEACEVCNRWIDRMNAWGTEGCRKHRGEIIQHLREQEARTGWLASARAAGNAVRRWLPWTVEGVVDEAIRRRAEKEKGIICVRMMSKGIGDTMLGLTSVAGLVRDHPDKRIVYDVRCDPAWPRLFYSDSRQGCHGGQAVYPYGEQGNHEGGNDDHDRQMRMRSAIPRWEYYARRCGTAAVLPTLRPLPAGEVTWAAAYRGCVVLAPFAYHESRRWPMGNWLALEQILMSRGYGMVIIGSANCDMKSFRSHRLQGAAPAKVAALLKGALGFIGLDSGMTHLAGLIGTPSLAICAGIRGEHLFGLYGCVRSVNGPRACTDCHWLHHLRRAADCRTFDPCASIAEITPEQVADAFDEHAVLRRASS